MITAVGEWFFRLQTSWFRSRLVQDSLHMLVRQGIVKLLTVFSVTYAMRRMGPEALGGASAIITVVTVAAVFCGLGMDVTGPKLIALQSDRADKMALAARLLSMKMFAALLIAPIF